MGISSSLPLTAAVKMIDIWMIFTMMYPFTGVMLQSYLQVRPSKDYYNSIYPLQYLRKSDSSDVVSFNKKRQEQMYYIYIFYA